MNLTLHLIRKDLRHFRLAALFWSALVLTQVIMTNWLLSADASDGNRYSTMCAFVNLLYFLGVVVSYLLAGVVTLADAPGSSVAQWQTRPISGGRLLTAKAGTSAFLFGLLPVLIWLPWWLYCGFGAAGLAGAATNVLLMNLVPAAIGVALAAVVDQLGRFMMLTMILAAALIVFFITSLLPREISESVYMSRLFVDLTCAVLAALIAIVIQYRTRQTMKSGTVLLAGVVAILAVRAWWPVDLSFLWTESPGAMAGADKVSGRIWHVDVDTRNTKDGQAEPFLVVRVGLTGLPEKVFVAGGRVDVELSWPDGTKVRREQLRVSEEDWSNRSRALHNVLGFSSKMRFGTDHWDPETQAKYVAAKAELDRRLAERGRKKVQRSESSRNFGDGIRFEIPVSPAIAAKVQAAPPVCRIVATLRARTPVVLGQMTLASGSTQVADGRVKLLALIRTPGNAKPESWQFGVGYVAALTSVQPPYGDRRTFHAVDPVHQIIDWQFSNYEIQGVPPLFGSIYYQSFAMQSPRLWRGDRWIEVPDWQKAVVVVVEEAQSAGNFSYTMTTERLEVSQPPDEDPPAL